MAVRIEKSFHVKEPVDEVWRFLSDPRQVVTCVPGAEIIEQVDERTYKGSISVKVGPSVSDYKGEVQVVRLDPEAHEIEILGKGQDVRGKGSASMKMTGKLTAASDGGSEVISVSELSVVGILAQMGGRMIQEVSNVMFEKFVKNFQQKLQAGPGEGTNIEPGGKPQPVNAVSMAFSALKSAVKRRDKPHTAESRSEASESSESGETGDDPEVK
ncbi:MAG: SRPBCC family protein [Acidobacteria bacterium]|nr:SRPBCC family protein [Acidobacteriota bacterium]